MNRRQARILILSWLVDASDNYLGFDAPYHGDYSEADVARIEREFEWIFDLLKRKLDRLETLERRRQ